MGKAGQRRYHRKVKSIFSDLANRLTREQYIENRLYAFEQYTKDQIKYWKIFQDQLAQEREERFDEIIDSILEGAGEEFLGNNLSRIVGTKFSQNPLCSIGSIREPPGGRFNYGAISPAYADFQMLYVASDFRTAFYEKYHEPENQQLDSEEMALREPESHLHVKLNLKLHKIIDLRDKKNLLPFFEVIKEIKPDKRIYKMARQYNFSPPTTVADLNLLWNEFFDRNYRRWAIWTDHPSPSQIFGYYCFKAGLEGIIYPSVRNKSGYNLGVLTENLSDNESFVRLIGEFDSIPPGNQEIRSANANEFLWA